MKKFLILFQFALIVFAYAANVQAATSDWHDLGGGKARLLANLDPATGKLSAALEVRLEEGWSTYWRYPGSSGIPPLFDFSATDGFTLEAVRFPAPKLLGNEQLRYAGYKEQVVFPISGTFFSGITPKIRLKLLIGVCATVCIPAQAEIEISTSELMRSDPLAGQIINLANLSVPLQVAAETVVKQAYMQESRSLMLTVTHEESGLNPALFVEGPSDWFLQPAKLMETAGGAAKFEIDLSRAPKETDISGHKLKYTLVNGSKGIEFIR